MLKPTINIDREKGWLTLTRKLPSGREGQYYTETVHFANGFDALGYIEAISKGLQKLAETPTPSGPKGN